LLEAVATAALQSRLRLHDKVEADISCNLLGLLAGQVDSVHIYGTGWQSKAGLTARVLEVCNVVLPGSIDHTSLLH